MICPSCGKKTADDSLFCEVCGARIERTSGNKNGLPPAGKMVYCGNCGKKIPENSLFCPWCNAKQGGGAGTGGTVVPVSGGGKKPVPGNDRDIIDVSVREMPKKKKGGKKILLIIVLVLVVAALAAGAFIFLSGRKTSIDLNSYVTVEIFGTDGSGTAEVTLDTGRLLKEYGNVLDLSNVSGTTLELLALSMDLSEDASADEVTEALFSGEEGALVCVELNRDHDLENGDAIMVKWDVQEDHLSQLFKAKFLYSNQTVEISGLPEGSEKSAEAGENTSGTGTNASAGASTKESNSGTSSGTNASASESTKDAGTSSYAAVTAEVKKASSVSTSGYSSIKPASSSATSTLVQTDRPDINNSASMMFDGNDSTSWQEGASDSGEGTVITMTLSGSRKIKYISFKMGNWRDENNYTCNNAPKEITLNVGGESFTLTFPHVMEEYIVVLSQEVETTNLSLCINSVYDAAKTASDDPADDTCISEITIYGK